MNSRLKFNQLSTALKQHCLLCASHDGADIGICAPCLQSLPWHTQPHCPQCGLSTPGVNSLCGRCLSEPPAFDATHSLFSYDYPVDTMLQHYKYQHRLHLAHSFAQLLLAKIRQQAPKHIDLIIPMPMHAARLKQRGFNQALEISRLLSSELQINLDSNICQRHKLTPPQASLPLKQRMSNIRGVFSCTHNISGLRIAIVDDVMTTGASLNELAKTLKKSGAAHVECWTIARTLAHHH